MASEIRAEGFPDAEPFVPLQIVYFKGVVAGAEQICAGRVIAMRDGGTVLVAALPLDDTPSSQRLSAGHVEFIAGVKTASELSASASIAQSLHGGLPLSGQGTLEDFVPSAALAAYHVAVDAGFVSAASSGGGVRPVAGPPALSTSSFVDLGPTPIAMHTPTGAASSAPGFLPTPAPAVASFGGLGPPQASLSVQEQVQQMLAQQAELSRRITAVIEPSGAGRQYSPPRGASGARGPTRAAAGSQSVSFDPTSGAAAMQAAAATLSGASGWGQEGQSPGPMGRAPSLASTVVPQAGFMGDGEDADMSSGESAPTGAQVASLPPLLAQGSQRRTDRRLRRQHALSFGLPTGLMQGAPPGVSQVLQAPGPSAFGGTSQQFAGVPPQIAAGGAGQGPQMFNLGSAPWPPHGPPVAGWADAYGAHAQMPAFASGHAAGQPQPMGQGGQGHPAYQGGMPQYGPQGAGPQQGGGGGYPFAAPMGAPLDPQAALTLEMARQLQRLRRRRGGNSGSGSSSSGVGSSSGRGDGHSIPSKLKAVLRLRARVQKHPMRILTKYRAKCLQRLGIYALPNGMLSAPYTHPQTSLHLRSAFGRMTGLWRCHFMLGHILEKLEQGQTEQAAATCVQALKAVHQTALDGGSWNCSTLLLPYEDPLARDLFGGDEDEMMATAAWNRGVRDLQSQVANLSHNSGGHQEVEDGAVQHTAASRADRRSAAAKGKAKAAAAAAAAATAGGAGRPS